VNRLPCNSIASPACRPQDEGDAVVSFLYCPTKKEVEKAEENEGDEGHHQEENVVPHLVIVR
jgi:hypothetical protein